MLSWNDDGDVFTKRAPLGKAGSLTRPGNSFEIQRATSSRTSVDVPVPPGSRKFGESALSPASSLTKASSLLRSSTGGGTIGSEGWWHHTDNGQMNETAAAEHGKINGRARAEAFVPQANVAGPKQAQWADDVPAAAATPISPAAAPAAAPVADTFPAAPAGVSASVTAAAPDGAATIQSAAAAGWWARLDKSVLNQPPDVAPLSLGAVQKGERVMGLTPQVDVAGGSNYGSIFAGDAAQQPQPQQQPGGGCSVEGTAAGDDGWSSFESAPTV